jgi:hypothetical protein
MIRFLQQGEGTIGSNFVRTKEATAVLQISRLSLTGRPVRVNDAKGRERAFASWSRLGSTHLLIALEEGDPCFVIG